MKLLIEKAARTLTLLQEDTPILCCPIALGSCPTGAKTSAGDGRTPEGRYTVCLVKDPGKYGRSLGLSYPSPADADRALQQGRIDKAAHAAILQAHAENRRPPWGTALGGEIYIHEGGTASDWTAGCIALDSPNMDRLFPLWEKITEVVIVP